MYNEGSGQFFGGLPVTNLTGVRIRMGKGNVMSELTAMRNIGKEMEKKLTAVGIDSAEKLIAAGAKQAFFKLKERYPKVCLVHLYSLEGAVCGVGFHQLPEDKKKELKAFSDFLKG